MDVTVPPAYAGDQVIVIYQKPNGTHHAHLYNDAPRADAAQENWKSVEWVETCRIEGVRASALSAVNDFLNIIDHLGKSTRFAEPVVLWMNAHPIA